MSLATYAVEPQMLTAPAVTKADVLDVDFQDGKPVDRAGGIEPVFVNAKPTYSTVNGTGVMSLSGGNSGSLVTFELPAEKWAQLSDADGLSVECRVRFDAAPTSTLPFCGAAASGNNFGLYTTATGLQAKVDVVQGTTSAYQDANFAVTLEQGKWYDVLGVYDGHAVKVYVNGVASPETAAEGVMRHNSSNAPTAVMIGGNAAYGGGLSGSAAKAATYAGMRIYSTPLTAADAAALAATLPSDAPETPEPAVTKADVLDVDFQDGKPVDRAGGVSPAVLGAPSYSMIHGTGAMSLDGDYVSFDLSAEKWAKLTDANGLSVECTVRFDGIASGPFCGSASGGNNFGLYAVNGGIQALFRVGTVYQTATVAIPLEQGKWYDVVGVYDGKTVTVYANGAASPQTAAPGVLQHTSAAPTMVMMGANPLATGATSNVGGPATYTSLRIYSDPLSAEDVAKLAAERPSDEAEAPGGPAADVLDVDFASAGAPVDKASNIPASFYGGGTPVYDNAGLLSQVSGADIAFGLSPEQWAKLTDANGLTYECVVKFDLTVAPNGTFCGSASAGNNFYLTTSSAGVGAYFRIGGDYQGAVSPVLMESGRWYDVIGVFDGKAVKLYVDGKLAAQTEYAGTLVHRDNAPTIVGINGNPDTAGVFHAGSQPQTTAHHAMRIWSIPLSAEDVAEHYDAEFGAIRDGGVLLNSSVPASNAHLTEATKFDFAVNHPENAIDWKYLLDGQEIKVGQPIGAGLAAGNHRIEVTATSILGLPLSWEIPFSSAAIPTGGGTETEQGDLKVQLSVIAQSPDGGPVTTTFKKADVNVAESGFQGTVASVPTTLDFEASDRTDISTRQLEDGKTSPSSTVHDAYPFQRFDVKVPAGGAPLVRWSGILDPAREIRLMVWDLDAQKWTEIGSARGAEQGNTVVLAAAPVSAVDDGVIHVLALAQDPFADDLAPRDESAGSAANRNHFEDPDDYQFSFVHWTDPQWLAQAATGGLVPGAIYPDANTNSATGIETIEEQALSAEAYRDALKWSVDNKDSKKIAFLANTGDITQTGYINDLPTDPSSMPAGVTAPTDEQRALANKEWDFTTDAFSSELANSGLVTDIVGGNHDVLYAENNATGDSAFSQRFTAANWYAQSQNWPAGASFHTMDETTNTDGTTATPGANMDNNYVLFSAGGLDFVAVGLSFGVTQQEADWANSIFEKYKDRNGILITHSYLNASGNPDGRTALHTADGGQQLYDQVVAHNPNVFLVLAGHVHGVGYNLNTVSGPTVDSQHRVLEFMADYQDYMVPVTDVLTPENCPTCRTVTTPDANGNTGIDVNGDGIVDHHLTDQLHYGPSFLNLLQFNTKNSTVSVDSYSPFLDKFGASQYDPQLRYNGAADNMTFPVDLSVRKTSFATDSLSVMTESDEVIDVATARSGWPAKVTWSGLIEGQTYGWIAISTADGEGTVAQVGGVFVATAGTDVTAPVIHFPEETTLVEGDSFDPLADVTVTDNTDGDLIGKVKVTGTVDTTTPGTYVIGYSVSDSIGNQATAMRTVTVKPQPEPTKTSLSVDAVRATSGGSATFTATIEPKEAAGTVKFLVNDEDVLCETTIESGTATCTVPNLGLAPGTYTILAVYAGDGTHAGSSGVFEVTVTGTVGGTTPPPTGTTPPPTDTTPPPADTPPPTTTPEGPALKGNLVDAEALKSTIAHQLELAPAATFHDVPATDWSANSITLASQIGFVTGYADGGFHPDASITRAEFAAMLVRALGIQAQESDTFSDTHGHWAEAAIEALKSNGVIAGYEDGTFKPDKVISRAEIAAILAKVMDLKDVSTLSKFTDISGNWAEQSINQLTNAGIINGKEDDRFDPNSPASRAESVALILRVLNVSLGLDLNL